jgi:hypothetical protein
MLSPSSPSEQKVVGTYLFKYLTRFKYEWINAFFFLVDVKSMKLIHYIFWDNFLSKNMFTMYSLAKNCHQFSNGLADKLWKHRLTKSTLITFYTHREWKWSQFGPEEETEIKIKTIFKVTTASVTQWKTLLLPANRIDHLWHDLMEFLSCNLITSVLQQWKCFYACVSVANFFIN